jgi:hypothetical protein
LAGKTVGRHYAGPRWEHADGSAIAAKLAGRAPGASASDIPLLKLKVIERRGNGVLSGVTTVQRIDTRGGAVKAPAPPPARISAYPTPPTTSSCASDREVGMRAGGEALCR